VSALPWVACGALAGGCAVYEEEGMNDKLMLNMRPLKLYRVTGLFVIPDSWPVHIGETLMLPENPGNKNLIERGLIEEVPYSVRDSRFL
jgi:hypothetical protein